MGIAHAVAAAAVVAALGFPWEAKFARAHADWLCW